MKTLILYATKHGAAKDIAERLAELLPDATVCDLSADTVSLADFDCVIFGSSVYAGSIRKEAKSYLSKNASQLVSKRFGLFLSGISAGESEEVFVSNFSPEILGAASTKSFIGGVFNPDKCNLFERIVIRLVTKKTKYFSTISDERIKKFAEELM
ncbi:MAG: flavodoxin domain-containing protein [Oscillospiraceae bacterium]|nr:flavodoxin domain-containing protein [Oscillospiraceae bacterium]